MTARPGRGEGFHDALRTRMTDALVAELTALWNRRLASGDDPERLAGVVEAVRVRLRSALPRSGAAPAESPRMRD